MRPRGPRAPTPSRRATRAPACDRGGAAGRPVSRPIIARASPGASTSARAAASTVRPRRSTVTRSATRRISSSLCPISSTVRPARASARRTSNSQSTSCGPSIVEGSSRMRTRGSRYSAFRISTRCLAPTERPATGASGSTGSPVTCSSSASRSRTRSSRSRRPLPSRVPSATFSATVRLGTSVKCWWTMPMPAATASRALRHRLRSPSTRTSPASGRSAPHSTRISVVLPAPFSPSRA